MDGSYTGTLNLSALRLPASLQLRLSALLGFAWLLGPQRRSTAGSGA